MLLGFDQNGLPAQVLPSIGFIMESLPGTRVGFTRLTLGTTGITGLAMTGAGATTLGTTTGGTITP